jgi:hypothetical protein
MPAGMDKRMIKEKNLMGFSPKTKSVVAAFTIAFENSMITIIQNISFRIDT